MGFHDLKLFNQALLARQAWRLIYYPDSLCARLLKAKYYRQGKLTNTTFPSNASPTWKAIEYGLELLKKGAIWRVANGQSIRIWRDNWIPREYSLKPITRRRRSSVRWVSDLISPNKEWDINLLRENFSAIDVDEILKIQLPVRPMEDVLAWNSEKSGIFSVKSAYKLAYNLHYAEHTSISSDFKNRRIQWSNIWNNDAPPKIKVFAWRLAKEALPTNVNKKNRHMSMVDMCDICGKGSEEGFHAVIDCQHSKNLMQAARKECSVPADALLHRNGPEWLLQLLDKLPKQDRGIFIMLLWKNWNDRNAITHGDQRHSMEGSLRALSALCKTLYQIRQPTQPQLKGKNVSHEYV